MLMTLSLLIPPRLHLHLHLPAHPPPPHASRPQVQQSHLPRLCKGGHEHHLYSHSLPLSLPLAFLSPHRRREVRLVTNKKDVGYLSWGGEEERVPVCEWETPCERRRLGGQRRASGRWWCEALRRRDSQSVSGAVGAICPYSSNRQAARSLSSSSFSSSSSSGELISTSSPSFLPLPLASTSCDAATAAAFAFDADGKYLSTSSRF